MLTLDELKVATSTIFSNEDVATKLEIPVPPQIWKDRIDALSEANLVKQIW